MKIGLANDHAGFKLKSEIKPYLESKGYEIVDFGSDSDTSVDYADYAHKLAFAVEKSEVDLGISICGSGNGINIAANKHQKVRSALCWLPEIGHLARLHNDANICALPGRFINKEQAIEIIDQFLNTPFEGGRHEIRINKIPLQNI
jgi:ribose 5-phosphate isomerase B